MTAHGAALRVNIGNVESPLGRMLIACSDACLVALSLPAENAEAFLSRVRRWWQVDDEPREPAAALVEQTITELTAYFASGLQAFTVPLAPRGTPFQLCVWEAVRAVPYGTTRSYGEVAEGLGRPSAARAVGHANGSNPLPIIVPCHRLVGRDGALTGYAGGLAMKRWLIEHERGRSPDIIEPAHPAC